MPASLSRGPGCAFLPYLTEAMRPMGGGIDMVRLGAARQPC